MIWIDDEFRLDSILNPFHNFSQGKMSNPKQDTSDSIEVVEIPYDGSSSTSDSACFSYETVDTRDPVNNILVEVNDNPSSIPSTSSTLGHLPLASVAPPSRTPSFEGLTVKVATPINPSAPKTIYAGVTNTGFSIHDLVHVGSSSRSSEDGDFVLKLNTSEPIDLSWAYSLVDRTKYRLKIIPALVSMSDYFIPVPIAHFLNGLRFPLDLVFVDFLLLIKSQPAHIHPNAIRYIMSLIVLCCRVGVEMSELILCTFFFVLRMNNRTFSLRPRPNVVTLFDAIPNKVLDWREKWLYVECNSGFPFPPIMMNLEAWHPIGKQQKIPGLR